MVAEPWPGKLNLLALLIIFVVGKGTTSVFELEHICF